MNKLTNYFKASYAELKKVIWPSRKLALQLTAIVVVSALLVGTKLTLLGYGFQTALQKLIFKN